MSNEEMLRQLAAGAKLEALDLFEISGSGGVLARIGLRVSLKFQNGHTVEKRKGGLKAMGAFYSVFKDQLTHWLPASGGSPRKIAPGQVPPIEQPEALADVGAWYGCRLYGYKKGEKTNDPALLSARIACAWNKQASIDSTFAAHLPLSWCVEHGFDQVRELVREWASDVNAVHGTAGISLLFEDDSASSYIDRTFFLLKKFPGLDYEDPVKFSVQVNAPRSGGSQLFKMRVVSWLTVLSDPIIAELGGRAAMGSALGPECPMFDYEGGVIIQAMPVPQLGSAEDGIIPEGYRKVARLTKSVRFEAYTKGLFANLPPPLDTREETLAWIRRFD
jgi:hypothetical protein